MASASSLTDVKRTVSTRFLILSDTDGEQLKSTRQRSADVVIHCGDLTEESRLDEYRDTIRLLKHIDAPLKLVIAGNHDSTLDEAIYQKKREAISIDEDPIMKEYGTVGEARTLFDSEESKAAGIVFLNEGTQHFTLVNGAALTVYASLYTPSMSEHGGGFQYSPKQQEHDWSIDSSVDVAITHCPPRGVLDYTDSKERAGSPSLFAAIARARPQIHRFGHIHESWGAKKVTWRSEMSDPPSHITDIDNGESTVYESLSAVRKNRFDSLEDIVRKRQMRQEWRQKFDAVGHVTVGDISLGPGRQTLLVNAAIEGLEEGQQQWPWLVDIELPFAKEFILTRQADNDGLIEDKQAVEVARINGSIGFARSEVGGLLSSVEGRGSRGEKRRAEESSGELNKRQR